MLFGEWNAVHNFHLPLFSLNMKGKMERERQEEERYREMKICILLSMNYLDILTMALI